MQTRRDQLQAYRFQNRRALAALVTGEPNVVEPPMRRLTVITIAGIMIAILVAVVFALLGKFSPDTGNSWQEAGAIIIEDDTGAIYVYDGKELHPVLNYASAVLAVGSNQKPHVVNVGRDDIRNAERGYAVGIRGLPTTMPPKSGLVSSPWSVCSTQRVDTTTNQLFARTTVRAGSDGGARAIPTNTPVVVRGVKGGSTFVLIDHQRLAVDPDVAASLQLNSTPVPVGTAFLNGVPAGPALSAPPVPGAGDPSTVVPGTRVGQLVRATDTQQVALVVRDGLQPLTGKVQAAILQTLRIGPGGGVQLPQATTTESVILSHRSNQDGPQVEAALKNLPNDIGSGSAAAQRAGGVCAVYRSGSTPTFAVPPGTAPNFVTGGAIETAASAGGAADEVDVPPAGAALIKSDDRARTVFVVAPPGKKFAVENAGVLSAFGYDGVSPVTLPRQLLPLIPNGPALSPTAVRNSRP